LDNSLRLLNNSIILRCGEKIIGKKNKNKVVKNIQPKMDKINKSKKWLQNTKTQIKKSPQKFSEESLFI